MGLRCMWGRLAPPARSPPIAGGGPGFAWPTQRPPGPRAPRNELLHPPTARRRVTRPLAPVSLGAGDYWSGAADPAFGDEG